MWRRLQKWSLCQLTTRRSPIAYLAILAYAVDCVLIIAELDRVDFSIMCLPAHGTLMLLHIWGENQYWTFPVLTQSWGEDRETFYVPEVSVTALQTSLGEPSPVPALGAYTPNFTLATKTIVYNYSTLQGCSHAHCSLQAFCIQAPLALLLPLLSCPSQLLTALSSQRPGTAASTCARSTFPMQRQEAWTAFTARTGWRGQKTEIASRRRTDVKPLHLNGRSHINCFLHDSASSF